MNGEGAPPRSRATHAAPSLRVVHHTRYRFERPVERCRLETCLEPVDATFHQVAVTPLESVADNVVDAFGNPRRRFNIESPFQTLEVCAVSTVARSPSAARWWPRVAASSDAALVAPTRRAPHLSDCVRFAKRGLVGTSLRARLEAFAAQLSANFTFDAGATDVDTPLARFVAERRGVCQDFAHFALACVRSRGIPAVYLSGYRARATQAGRSHAWVAVRDGEGWLELDPTSGLLAPADHLVMAVGRDYDDVPPITGALPYEGVCRALTRVAVTPLDAPVDA